MFYLETLGRLALRRSDPEGARLLSNSKSLGLLAYVASTHTHQVSREHIAQLLWPGGSRKRARQSLRQALHFLLDRCGAQLVEADESLLRLKVDLLRIDLWDFDRAMKEGKYSTAVHLYHGPFLAECRWKPSLEFEHWAEAQDEQVRAALRVAYAQLVSQAVEEGDADRATRYACAWVEVNPLNEEAQAHLQHALQVAGDPIGAVRAAEAYRAVLQKELDRCPSEQFNEVAAQARGRLPQGVTPLTDAVQASGPDDPGPSSGRLSKRSLSAAVTGFGVILLLASAMILWGRRGGDSESLEAQENVVGQFLAQVRTPHGEGVAAVRLEGDALEIEGRILPHGAVLSPTTGQVAFPVPVTDGLNLAISDLPGTVSRTLTVRPDDEYPRDWSPDGSYVLFAQGAVGDGGRSYRYTFWVLNVATGEQRQLAALTSSEPTTATWSPDGSQIAFVADRDGQQDVYLVDFDGSSLRNLSAHSGSDRMPAWSPDGQHIAFVSNRDRDADIFTVRRRGSGLRRLTDLAGDEVGPAWISPSVVAFTRMREDGGHEMWTVDRSRLEYGRLDHPDSILRIMQDITAHDEKPWIESVRISPLTEHVSPGQHVQLQAQLKAAGGRAVEFAAPIRWSVADTAVASISRSGRLQIKGPGTTTVIADVGGWRADTLRIVSTGISARPIRPLFVEHWTQGLRPKEWMDFGTPRPIVRTTGGPEGGGVFLSNGDAHHASGAATRRTFSLRSGATAEVWGRMLFTEKLYQMFAVGFYPGTPPSDGDDWPDAHPVVGLQVKGPSAGDPAWARVYFPSHHATIAMPDDLDNWHHYALQVDSLGGVSVIIDGRLHWRSSKHLPLEELPSVHLVLGDRTVETEISHGTLRVYPGPRYQLP